MNVIIEFNTDNAAFEDSFLMEVTRVLGKAKSTILESENANPIKSSILDTNGNRIGYVEVSLS